MNDKQKEKDILQITIRLFIAAKNKWNITIDECAELFDKYEIDEYIEACYESFHVQSDSANMEEIEEYMRCKGYAA